MVEQREGVLCDGVPKTRHVVSDVVIDIAENRTAARARSAVLVFQAVPGDGPRIIFQGAYDDTFVRGGEGWRFDERRIHADGTGDMSGHLRGADPQAVGAPA